MHKIQILQGLNLESKYTKVKFKVKNCDKKIMEFFKEIHPVLMFNFEIYEDQVIIDTFVPYLWSKEDFLSNIAQLSEGKLDFITAKNNMLEIAKITLGSMSSIPTLETAHKLGYETTQFFINNDISQTKSLNRYLNIGIGHESGVICSASSTGDSALGKKIQKDKWLTNSFLENMNIPLAKWMIIDSINDLKNVEKEIAYPMVIKPVGLTGGKGVYMDINSFEQLEYCYKEISRLLNNEKERPSWQQKIMAQRKVEGNDYRLLVVNGKFQIATHRVPAQIVSDGIHTVEKQILLENQRPERDISLITHVLKPIKIDNILIETLNEQGLNLTDRPEKNIVIKLKKVASMSQGGITIDVTEQINSQTKLLCETIARTMHVNVLGIDLICKDITKPISSENGSIIEVNTMPEIYLNTFPTIGKHRPEVSYEIIKGTVNNVHTNTVAFIGEYSMEEIEKIVKSTFNTNYWGLFADNSIFINNMFINKSEDIVTGVLSLKKNKLLDTIVINYRSINEVINHGFGFNKLDLLVLNETNDMLENKIKKYTQEQLINKVIKN